MSELDDKVRAGMAEVEDGFSTPAGFAMVRALLGLGVEQMAEILCVDRRTIQRWEKGTSRIPPSVAKEVEELLRWADQIVLEYASQMMSGQPEDASYSKEPPVSMHSMIVARVAVCGRLYPIHEGGVG